MKIWKPVTGYTGYLVSNDGQVKSIDRAVVGKNGVTQNRKGKVLKLVVDNTEYQVVTLYECGMSSNHSVHVLVAAEFVSGREPGLVVNHIDGNKLNCVCTNLEWVTRQYNNIHAIETLLNPTRGETNIQAKLSNDDVVWIRSNYIPRHDIYGGVALAARFNVHNSTISGIANGRDRKHG